MGFSSAEFPVKMQSMNLASLSSGLHRRLGAKSNKEMTQFKKTVLKAQVHHWDAHYPASVRERILKIHHMKEIIISWRWASNS